MPVKRVTSVTNASIPPGSSVGWLVGSLLLGLCSMVGKEQGITVVALCLMYDFFIVHKVQKTSYICGCHVFVWQTLSMLEMKKAAMCTCTAPMDDIINRGCNSTDILTSFYYKIYQYFLQHKIYQVWHPRTISQKDNYARLIHTLEIITTILIHRPARPVPLVQPVRPWLWGGKDDIAGVLTYRDAALWSIDSST